MNISPRPPAGVWCALLAGVAVYLAIAWLAVPAFARDGLSPWLTNREATELAEYVLDQEDEPVYGLTCLGYGRTPKDRPRRHRRFRCFGADENGVLVDIRLRVSTRAIDFYYR